MESLGNVLRNVQMARQAGIEPEPSSQGPVCPRCLGAGYLRYDVHVDDPRFGQLVACECTERLMQKRRLEQLVAKSNLADLRHLTFESDSWIPKYRDGQPPSRTPDAAWRVARRYAQEPVGWLVLYGAVGTGKTHLAVAIANYRLGLGEPAVFIVVPDLLDHLRSTFSPNSDVTYDDLFETVRNTPLLIMDDLGTQTTTPWAQEKLYQILNHRYNRALPTVITSNLDPETIEPRLRSRIFDPHIATLCDLGVYDRRLDRAHPAGPPAQPARRPTRKVRESDRL